MSSTPKSWQILCQLIILLLLVKQFHCVTNTSSKHMHADIQAKPHNHKGNHGHDAANLHYHKKSRRPASSHGNENYTMLIAGGYRASKLSLTKHIVSIRTSRATAYFGDNHFCVGAIISEQLVITAAHCVVDRRRIVTRAHRLLVVAGTPNRLLRTITTVERKVIYVLPHDKYVRKGSHDIAILRLANRLPDDNDNVKVIPLIDKELPAGTPCNLVGWGQLFYRGPYTATAVHANLSIISKEECKAAYPRKYDESMICAGRKGDWEVDACRGDSGGPLICKGAVAGIVSWSINCGEKGKPTVFTSVYHHRDWINFAGEGNTIKATSFLYLLLFVLIIDLIFAN